MKDIPTATSATLAEQYRSHGLVYYTPREECVHTVTHALGVVGAVALLVAMLHTATTPASIATAVVSSLLLAVQFGVSALYHAARRLDRKSLLRRLDYPAVSLNVLACGSAFSLLYGHVYGYVAFGVGLGLVALTLCLCLADFARFKPLGVVSAFVVGGLMFGSFLAAYLSPAGIIRRYPVVWYHLAGLLCSLAGAAFFAVRRPYMHAVFHVLVLVGPMLCMVGNLCQLS